MVSVVEDVVTEDVLVSVMVAEAVERVVVVDNVVVV